METLNKLVSEKSVVVFSQTSCMSCQSIKTLLGEMGASLTVYELDEHSEGKEIEQALNQLGCSPSVPAVFIGGKLAGGASQVMSLHLSGDLVQMLKMTGALWL